MTRRGRIETGFQAWGVLVVRWRWLAIAACIALSAVLISKLPELRVDNSTESFLHSDDPARIRYDQFRDQFDRDDRIMVVLGPGEIFDQAFLEKLRSLHREIEREVPYLEEVTSLINARNTRGKGDELIVEDLMEDWPESAADVEALRARVLANPLYINILISDNEQYTIITLKPFTYSTLGPRADELAGFDDASGAAPDAAGPLYLSESESFELVEALLEIQERYEGPDLEIHLVGGPTFDHRMMLMLQRDATRFMVLSLLLTFGLLYLLFRRVSGMILPMVVVLISMLSSMGLMVWLDIPFSVTLNMLPVFLLVVGVCDSVHILTIVYRQIALGRTPEDAIADALGHSGLAVVMTSVTTACGVLSFRFADLAPIAQLGTVAPAGVLLAMAYSLVLLPALLAVFPPRPSPRQQSVASRGMVDAFLARVGDLSTLHPKAVLAVTAAVLLAGMPGLLRVHFAHDGMRWFPAEDPLRVALELVNRDFKGASSLEVLVHTGRENGLYEPDVLGRIERSMRHIESLDVAGHPVNKAISIVDVVKETNQALNENRSEFYELPDERLLIAQELLLFENSGSDDLEDLTDSQFSTSRVTVRTPWVDAMLYPAFLEEVESSLREILGDDLTMDLTGGAVMFTRIFEGIIRSMARSYVFALAVITPIMILLIGNLRRGLAAMIPNLIPIYMVLALMGWLNIPLDVSTLLIGGIVIGLAVDDTIHFMHKFVRYYEESGDAHLAVHETLATTGSALLFTSLVLACGFAVFMAAYMQNAFWFGLLTCFATIVAFLADILVAPALMVLVTRREARAHG